VESGLNLTLSRVQRKFFCQNRSPPADDNRILTFFAKISDNSSELAILAECQ
jgi:hypothetical protein